MRKYHTLWVLVENILYFSQNIVKRLSLIVLTPYVCMKMRNAWENTTRTKEFTRNPHISVRFRQVMNAFPNFKCVCMYAHIIWIGTWTDYKAQSRMGATRKLQGEIDKVLKKVQEGVDVFDSIWNKVWP